MTHISRLDVSFVSNQSLHERVGKTVWLLAQDVNGSTDTPGLMLLGERFQPCKLLAISFDHIVIANFNGHTFKVVSKRCALIFELSDVDLMRLPA